MFYPKLILVVFIFLPILVTYGANLPPKEVEALQAISITLGKMDWNTTEDPCARSFFLTYLDSDSPSGLTCDCTFVNNTICHIIKIVLKEQNLRGSLPSELVRFPFLQEITLDRNYLNGTIPPEWGSMNLQTISLLGNLITGSIPRELANISTLRNLNLEFNQLSGSIPWELGNLPQLEIIAITSNNLTGELPESLGRVTTLKEFRIGDNNFTGRIPSFIQNWTDIDKIFIQGCGLTGPIPTSVSSLTKLTDLRISNLNGNESTFPPLSALRNLKKLILRSCNIGGSLPSYIGAMTTLEVLDLSFNRLTGPIPDTFVGLSATCNYIYLTGNSLTGSLPNWMRDANISIDLSYNNLTNVPSNSNCQLGKLNLFASSDGNTTGTVSCLRSLGCQPKYYLRINCGGGEVRNDRGITYDTDGYSIGSPSNFIWSPQKSNWGLSNTGHFLDNSLNTDSYTVRKESNIIGPNSHLYMDARVSPLSLTYVGCLHNGNYTVNLHFAEIMLTDDKIGRRIFDIYIQRSLVLKDFNIEDEAGGVDRPLTKNFTVDITDATLDIRFYWAGKGTTGIPGRGIYGPLISAISVDPNFPVPAENENRIPGRMITIGIVAEVVGGLVTVALVMGILWWKGCLKRESTLEDELRGLELQTRSFTLKQIKDSTNNFDRANKIGEGGFGPVYKGHLSDGTAIAVKQLSSKSKQGNREFINEIGMISALQHPHLVKLYGCCIEGNELLLIYEYLENNSLARALFGPPEHQLNMDWSTRHKICIGIAKGLAYLHEESRLKMVHRDIKAANVLLDKNLSAKISDFGLAKLDEVDSTHISTRIAGTYGYMAPEYAMRGYLTNKADVYSFGVVVLEVVSGRINGSIRSMEDRFNLLDWAISLYKNGDIVELVDPKMESKFRKEEVVTTIQIALHCTNVVATERPNMSVVVSILEGKTDLHEVVSDLSFSMDKTKPQDILTE